MLPLATSNYWLSPCSWAGQKTQSLYWTSLNNQNGLVTYQNDVGLIMAHRHCHLMLATWFTQPPDCGKSKSIQCGQDMSWAYKEIDMTCWIAYVSLAALPGSMVTRKVGPMALGIGILLTMVDEQRGLPGGKWIWRHDNGLASQRQNHVPHQIQDLHDTAQSCLNRTS